MSSSMNCPKVECRYAGSEHGVKVHYGRSHEGSIAEMETCEKCGNPFKVHHVSGSAAKYCSKKCADAAKAGIPLKEYEEKTIRRCRRCRDIFRVPPSSDRMFCSRGCSDADWSENGSDSELSKVMVECAWCGVDFSVYPSRVERSEKHFCDDACQGQWQSENWNGESHPFWRDYDEAWIRIPLSPERREEVLERDESKCWLCGLSQGAHRILMGHGLHIHHIVPRRIFLERYDELREARKEANRMNNLIVVCNTCHHEGRRREGEAAELEMVGV